MERLDGRNGHDVAWELLRQLYREKVEKNFPEIRKTPMGKPCFSRGKWHFSIAHSQNHALCALADTPVGLDAEELSRRVNLRLAESILSPMEKAQFDEAEDKNRALLTFWVLKEAEGKRSGAGVGFHPNRTNFMLTDSGVFEKDGCLIALLTQEDRKDAL